MKAKYIVWHAKPKDFITNRPILKEMLLSSRQKCLSGRRKWYHMETWIFKMEKRGTQMVTTWVNILEYFSYYVNIFTNHWYLNKIIMYHEIYHISVGKIYNDSIKVRRRNWEYTIISFLNYRSGIILECRLGKLKMYTINTKAICNC